MRNVYSTEIAALTRWMQQPGLQMAYWHKLCAHNALFISQVTVQFADFGLPLDQFWMDVLVPVFKLIGLQPDQVLSDLPVCTTQEGRDVREALRLNNAQLVLFTGSLVHFKPYVQNGDSRHIQHLLFAIMNWIADQVGDMPSEYTHDVKVLYP
jgi:hypothetical protein